MLDITAEKKEGKEKKYERRRMVVGVLVYRKKSGHRFDSEGCENRICPFEFVPTEISTDPEYTECAFILRNIGRD